MIEALLWLLGSLVGMSLAEYAGHRWLMHCRIGGRYWYWHERLHHGRYYRRFNEEDSPEGRYHNILLGQYALAGLVLLTCWLPLLSAWGWIPVAVVCVHNVVWSWMHETMHGVYGQPIPRLLRPWAWWHFLHHRHVNHNYNATLPFGDLLFGTWTTGNATDQREWSELETQT